MSKWKEHRYWCWYLVASDGEILDVLTTGIGSSSWNVKSTGKSYINLESAKKAAKKAAEKASMHPCEEYDA